jgi:hypothetical protein
MTTFQDLLRSIKDERELISMACRVCMQESLIWNGALEIIFLCLHRNDSSAPLIKGSSSEVVLLKWLTKYFTAFNSRISCRASNAPGTMADSVIDFLIKSRFGSITEKELNQIKFAHRLSMSAENVLGLFLEEYLANSLGAHGWHCCWGETMRSVDFCHESGRLLQIKNRSNSENSSSSRVRIGTEITKWYRVDARTGGYKWNDLNEKTGCSSLSEDSFRDFIANAMKKNPAALAIDSDSPWNR